MKIPSHMACGTLLSGDWFPVFQCLVEPLQYQILLAQQTASHPRRLEYSPTLLLDPWTLTSCLSVSSYIMEFTQAHRMESLTIIRFLPVMISLWLVDLLGRVPWHCHHIFIKWTLCLQEWASLFLALVHGQMINRGCSNSNLPEEHPFRISAGKLWG